VVTSSYAICCIVTISKSMSSSSPDSDSSANVSWTPNKNNKSKNIYKLDRFFSVCLFVCFCQHLFVCLFVCLLIGLFLSLFLFIYFYLFFLIVTCIWEHISHFKIPSFFKQQLIKIKNLFFLFVLL